MKFTNGYWGIREGMTVQNAVEVRDAHVAGDAVTVYSAAKRVQTKGIH